MDARWSGIAGPVVEGVAGGLTMLLGSGIVLWLGFGPWTCVQGGAPCYGLLGVAPYRTFDLPSILLIWLPLVSVAVLGVGALLNAIGRPMKLAGWRWAAALGVGAPTVLLLVISPLVVFMMAVFGLSLLTAGLGELRSRCGDAPASVAGPLFGGFAAVALLILLFLGIQGLLVGLGI